MLFLADLGGTSLPGDLAGPWAELYPLRAGLALVASDAPRSVVYHALKDELPPDTPLLVAQLHEVPKIRGMAPGALAWARRQAL